MQSHRYNLSARELGRIVLWPLLPLACFAVLMHAGARFQLLPRPLPALDMDRTILLHQAEACLRTHPARVLLVGDSSCLMDVSAAQLEKCGIPALNLGTLSYLNLAGYGQMIRHYLQTNPDRVDTIVLLMHPEALRQAAGSDYHLEVLNRFYEVRDFCPLATSPIACGLGSEIFRSRFLGPRFPIPLGGKPAEKYGFTTDLWNVLSASNGSALDPNRYDPSTTRGNSEYRLANSLEQTSVAFARVIPKQIKLHVGITPIPESEAPRGFAETHRQMLNRWSGWLQADATLALLPPALPDRLFASKTHLNEAGQAKFTELLCAALGGNQR